MGFERGEAFFLNVILKVLAHGPEQVMKVVEQEAVRQSDLSMHLLHLSLTLAKSSMS